MTKQGTILVVDDNKGILAAVQLLLGTCFEQVITLSNPNQILNTLRENPVDLVLLDMNFSAGINNGNEGLFWLSKIHKTDASIPVVLFTAYADIDLAVRGIKEGAFDFVVKPWDNAKLLETLRNAYSAGKTDRRDNGYSNKQPTGESGMYWGTSERMTQLRSLIAKVALTDANLLITGENGTGKEMLAREIHRLSGRRQKPMVTVDMGAVSETLFESELFGHVKGSFTDADRVLIGTLREKLLADKKLRKAAKVDGQQIFEKNVFPKVFDQTAQASYIESTETYTKLFEDTAKYRAVMIALAKELYRELRNSQEG